MDVYDDQEALQKQDYIQKQEDDTFGNEQEVLTISTPSAIFREELNDSATPTITALESEVPELVNAAALQEPSVMSAVTYPMELADHCRHPRHL
jgi:hypothetical protein